MWKKILILTLLVLFLDQITKLLVVLLVRPYAHIPVIGNFIRITYIRNPFGIFGLQYRLPIIPLIIVTIAVIFFVLYKSKLPAVALIFGGAIGNLIDRIRIGAVIDWIDIGVRRLRWPTFNLADAAITIGIFWLIIRGIRKK